MSYAPDVHNKITFFFFFENQFLSFYDFQYKIKQKYLYCGPVGGRGKELNMR